MSLWFSTSSVVPALREEWALSTETGILLTVSVQLGFAAGAVTSAVFNLADRIRPHVLVALSASLGAALTLLFPLIADQPTIAVLLRLLTGFALAGVYPTGMRIAVSWFPRARNIALGVLLSALALGSATPQLLNGIGTPQWRTVLVASAVLALLGAAIAVVFVRIAPGSGAMPPWAPGHIVRMFRDPAQRLVSFGYFGHMWELYGLWAWLPAYIAASYARDDPANASQAAIGVTAFAVIGVGGTAGCLLGGWLADRIGGLRVARTAMLLSSACSVLSVLFFGADPILFCALLFVWGATAIADSGQFSAALSEVTDSRYVGTALTVQTAIGFLVTVLTIQGLPLLADAIGWRAAVPALAVGPIFGAFAMTRLIGRNSRSRRNDPSPVEWSNA